MIAARLRPNPVFSFSADHLDALGTGFDATNNGGPPEIAWRVDVPLERGGKRSARIALASAVKSAAEAQFADAVRGLTQDVTLACIDVIAAQASRTLLAENLHAFEELARQARPDLRALQLAQARSVADLRLQEALGTIDYTVGAEYRRQQGIAGRGNSLGLFFSTPLPFSNRNQGEIARATAERTQADRHIAAREAQIAADVQSAFHEHVTTRELVADIEGALIQPATKARDTSAYMYRSGGTSLVELLDAQRAFNDAMQGYVDARAGLRRAATRLN